MTYCEDISVMTQGHRDIHDITVPVREGALLLGTWQQIFLLECDIKPRTRTVAITVQGEPRSS
ncbi:MAG: hypothetical protein E4H02_10415 [Lentisphaerales bacterium]|jgi:thiamine phosphate synthase YjbQ (UPF0047 family)|nr:MAG: hypothetical protein E4H02_10415 [Lentisphaerales bacterium]